MSALYLSDHAKAALRAVDLSKLERVLDDALLQRRMTGLHPLQLTNCGDYVANQLSAFDRALAGYATAKAVKKREEMHGRAWLAGRDLGAAVRAMLERADKEDREREFFQVDDTIRSPHRFSEHMEIRVNFDWRVRAEDPWKFGTITFVHDVNMRADHTMLLHQPKRKPSATKLERERQDTLYRHWEHLRSLAVNALREFLQKGGDAATIPERFVAKTLGCDSYLNNFSCDFWQERKADGVI